MMLATLPVELNQTTDIVTIVGSVATVVRSGVLLWRGDLWPISIKLGNGWIPASSLHSSRYLWELGMSAISIAQTHVVVDQVQDKIHVTYDNGETDTLDGFSHLQELAAKAADPNWIAKTVLYAKMVAESPDGANLTTQVGAQVSVNPAADIPVVYTPPLS